MIQVQCFPVGELQANCYFVRDTDSKRSYIVDPGDSSEELLQAVEDFGAEKLVYILLTHGHFDHIGMAARLKRKYPLAKIVISQEDAPFTENDHLNLSAYFEIPVEHFVPDLTVTDGSVLPFGDNSITVLATPGHTGGSVCYRYGDMLFTGDTIMRCTTGRMDFPTGSVQEMLSSVKKIAALEGQLTLYCGHGQVTDLEYERKNNIAMRKSSYDDLY